ncbi:hypothetical protein SAMN05660649_00471 [Desulfotomaculum arcticum]|uniref:SipL SPOCS domain-containing protein n=1 Tax=Desulfotruncus arcticus DSM 17038 TaxID=1121424 RepID=A0A1I2NEL9_9FIRM|nr:SPOCS domain-containing protein [Desulfotruncus arcticus]SFG01289.1 hypothetical protein SAMN05660649_00471 [Desulfotomaculum arcticum] [Desulfotruncus arcticus DSM 17038]
MPIQYFYSEPDNVLCVKVDIPVVLAEDEVQVIVDNVAALPEMAQKVDHIDARLDDFDARPIFIHENGDRWVSVIEEEGWERFGWHWSTHRQPVVKKVLVSGILHKQIYYVDKHDIVKHVGEDIPFSDDVTLAVAQPVVNEDNVYIKLHHKKIDMRWDLRRGSQLQQTGVMIFQVKVVEDRQIFVQVCPRFNPRCPGGVNIVKDGVFESWATNTNPVFWKASNVLQSSSVLLGAEPSQPAYLFQIIDRNFPNVSPDCEYRLCFDAKEIPGYREAQRGTASYSLTVELFFFNGFGNVVASETKSWNASQISDDRFTNYCLNAISPGETIEGLVRFSFIPVNHVGGATRGCLPPPCKPPIPPPFVPPIPPPCLPPPCVPPMPPPCLPPIPPPCVPPVPGAPVNTSAVVIDNVNLECTRELT